MLALLLLTVTQTEKQKPWKGAVMEYEVVILGLFIFVVLLMIFHRKIEKLISNIKFGKTSSEYIYAHSLLMETGEILSRAPTDRYPDMESNQKKVKLYYQRLKDSPF